MFLCVCLFVSEFFLCVDYSRSNEQIFIINFMWEDPGQRKKLLIFVKDMDHILDTKKIMTFLRSHFQCIFSDFGFLLDISSKVLKKIL